MTRARFRENPQTADKLVTRLSQLSVAPYTPQATAHSSVMTAAQVHPLEQRDRPIVDRLLATDAPDQQDLVDCARLLLRYQDFPGATALQADLQRALARWTLSRQELFAATRSIWASGFRPASGQEAGVGSGADVAAE